MFKNRVVRKICEAYREVAEDCRKIPIETLRFCILPIIFRVFGSKKNEMAGESGTYGGEQ
jgi:hypothetical protein